MRVERRFSKNAEVRTVPPTGTLGENPPRIEGYAAVFNEDFILYEDSAYLVKETIAPGAFSDVLGDDVRCLFNHDADNVLGRTESGTLVMAVDDKGLAFINVMDTDTRIGKDVYQFVKRGDVTGCSFAFIVSESTWTEMEVGGRTEVTRTIKKLSNLYDVGPVTYPAYPQTSVDARVEQRSAAFMELPEELRKRIEAGKPAPVMSEEQKAAYRRLTEIRTTL